MRRLLWIVIIIFLAFVILLLLRWCHRGEGMLPGTPVFSRDCYGKSTPGVVCLGIGTVSTSVWDDGTVALSFPLENRSDSLASKVQITGLTFGGGSRAKPAALPSDLGNIAAEQATVVDARFSGLSAPATYDLDVAVSYLDGAATRGFHAHLRVPIAKSADGDVNSTTTTVPKHVTPGAPLPPVKTHPENDNPAGPPVPDGPAITPLPVPPQGTSTKSAAGASSVTFIRDTSGNHPSFPAPADPSTAAGGGLVLSTGNAFLLLSTDDGVTFTQIDPTTVFPNADGGLCCDQVMLYDPAIDLYFWLLQYRPVANPADPSKAGPNRLRVAWASPASIKSNSSLWSFVDLQAQVLSKTKDDALDYPDLAFTNSNLYVSVDRQVSTTGVSGLIVARIPLAHITAGGATVGVSWLGPDQTGDQHTATAGRLTQSTTDTMYWAGHVDASKVKVFRWADSDSKVHTHDVKVNTWCKTAADYASVAPDAIQWIDTTRANISAVSSGARRPFSDPGKSNGEVWLAWNSGKDDGTNKCSKNRPQPFVQILRVNDQNLDGIGEYHIWNSGYAFAYAALATSAAGEIGVSVPFGGASDFATSTVGFLNDFQLYYLEASDVTLSTSPGTRIGDYYGVRNSGPNNVNLSSEGYALRLTNPTVTKACTSAADCEYHMHYIEWGRPPVTIQ
jgi:hypothetical protein